MHSINADLYKILFKTAIDKAIQVRVRWMPSHLACADSRPSDVSELDILGNSAADQEAGLMAKYVTVPLNVSAPILYYYNLVKRIQRRLVAIIMSLPDRVKYKRIAKPKESGEPLDSLVSQSSHVVYLQFGRYQCARCLNSFNA